MSSALTGCFLAVKQAEPLEAAAEALAAFGVAGEDAAPAAKGPGSSKPGADPPIGLEGFGEICAAASAPAPPVWP
jgi:hypothetical protein